MGRASSGEVWRRIEAHQHERFETITGKPFTYVVDGNQLTVDRTDYPLHASDFAKALDLVPLAGPGEINFTVRGPAYIWAILHDERIRQGEW